LFAEPPSNMDELQARAVKYIIVEENTEAARRTKMPIDESNLDPKFIRESAILLLCSLFTKYVT